MDNLLHLTKQWLDKAVAYIRSLKLHTRDLQHGEERNFSVLRAIEDTRLLLSHRLRLSRCSLTVSCKEPQPMVHGDPSKLGQVLTNLIGNAIDAYSETKSGGGEIRIEVRGDDSSLEIRVNDRGCGVPPELQERIFDEFFSMKPPGEGAGLGLSIARHLVANFFGGTISVESAPDQGSTFSVRLPRNRP
jgi:signal transduction histidine kinase